MSSKFVELISNVVELKKVGKVYKGLCPFHKEKTPSFAVTPETETWYCFGCDIGGIGFESFSKKMTEKYKSELPFDPKPINEKMRKEIMETQKKYDARKKECNNCFLMIICNAKKDSFQCCTVLHKLKEFKNIK